MGQVQEVALRTDLQESRGPKSGPGASEMLGGSAFFRFAQLGNHREVFKRSRIALDLAMRSQFAQQPAHDLADFASWAALR